MQRGRFLLDAITDAWRCLAFERSRKPSFSKALYAWWIGQTRRWQRLRRMQFTHFAAMLRVESACATMGLVYPKEDSTSCAPWHLAERFSQLDASQLPPHPVIDPNFVGSGFETVAPVHGALQALAMLLTQPPPAACWAGLALYGDATAPEQVHQPAARVAVCLHLFYPELWADLYAQLRLIPEPWDLYLSVPAFAATPVWRDIQRDHPRVRFMRVANRGRDVAPFLSWLRSGALDGYDAVCKLHGKRSPHMQGGDAWRDELLLNLIGSPADVGRIVACFRADPGLGMVGPSSSERTLCKDFGWAKNKARVKFLSYRLGLPPPDADYRFFAGTMFWFRPAAFSGLIASELRLRDFPIEMSQTDGTAAHALERLLPAVALASNHRVMAWPQTAPNALQH